MKFRASRSKAYLHKSSERSAENREKTVKTLKHLEKSLAYDIRFGDIFEIGFLFANEGLFT